jgi:hypothetical protein
VDDFRSAAQLGFEQLASRLPREHSDERAKCVIISHLDPRCRKGAIRLRKTSSSLASFAFSFGHDTPARVIVDSRFAAFVMAMKGRHLSAAPKALYLASSAEGVFGAVIARRDNRRDRINLSESGSCRDEALERRSEALHIGRCGGRAVRHERDVSNIRLVPSAVNRDQSSTIAQVAGFNGAQAASTPAGRAGRTVEAQRRALTPPSTASQFDARWASDRRQSGGEIRPTI